MSKILSTTIMLLWVLFPLVAQNNPDAILGVWQTESKDARMEIFRRGDLYYGKLLWGNRIVEADGKTSKKDIHNPDGQLKSRNIIGIVNLSGLKYENGIYINGTIYDPPSGRTYDCKAWLEDGKLQLRGFIGLSVIGRTATWHKLK